MAQDILMNSDNELLFADGDFAVGESDDMHLQHIITANKGQYYESPLVGVGILRYQAAPFDAALLQKEIREQINADGGTINNIRVTGTADSLQIDAKVKYP